MIDIEDVTWPDEALEPAVIGDQLAQETAQVVSVTSACTVEDVSPVDNAAVALWTGQPNDWSLAGTSEPGDVHLACLAPQTEQETTE